MDRIARFAAELERAGLAGALVMHPVSVYYLAGTGQPANLLVVPGQEPVLYARRYVELARAGSRVADVREGAGFSAIELSFFQREIADFAYDIAKRKASGELPVIGVNRYVDEGEDHKVEVHKIDPETEKRKIGMLQEVKSARDEDAAQKALATLTEVARDHDANLMPATIDAVKARATMGEIVNALEGVFGRYVETPVF